MPVGEYAGVALQDAADTWRNGAVFLLRKSARDSATVLMDGWVTKVVGGAKFVVTCGPSSSGSFDTTFEEALTAANRALDSMSIQGQADCAIRDAHDDCLVWWPDPAHAGTIMRCRAISTLGFVMNFTATVQDASGNVVPSPPPPTPMIHDAYRFIRMSRTSDDLYDSYRNLFLAFECLLSNIRPPKQMTERRGWRCLRWGRPTTKWESETQWFKAALTEANKLVPLESLTPPGEHTNHAKWVMKHMYDQERSALMHAKQNRGRGYLLPQDLAKRSDLTASLGRLWTYIVELVNKHLGVTRRGGYLSLYAVEKMATGGLSAIEAIVSDDDSGVLNREGGNLIAQEATAVALRPSQPAPDPDDPRLWTVLAHCDASDLTELSAIRRFGVRRLDEDGRAEVLSEFVGAITLGSDVTRLELVHGIRNVNFSDARRQFSS